MTRVSLFYSLLLLYFSLYMVLSFTLSRQWKTNKCIFEQRFIESDLKKWFSVIFLIARACIIGFCLLALFIEYSLFIQSGCAGVRSDWALWSCVHRRRASFAFDLKDPLTRQTIRQWVASSRSEQWHEPSRTTRLQHVYPYTLTWAKGSIRTRCTKQERWPSSWRIELQISWQPADKM
jgi:hypothetical protein